MGVEGKGTKELKATKGLQKPIRTYKDTIFRMIFKEKRELLSLFNTINGTQYDNPDDLEINTLENVIYMSMKNDISCVLDMQLNLYEHQSTVNPNMPLRNLYYVARLYEKITLEHDIYSAKQIKLPTPKFIVLYNGEAEQPERKELRLSDAFMTDTGEINLELIVLQLNINSGYNRELAKNCKTLYEYIQYTERVRKYSREMPLKKAVERAVEECIREDILADFLKKNKAEVIHMSIFEYDEEKHMRTIREEGIEQGIEKGIEQGEENSRYKIICNMLRDSQSPEIISKYTEQPIEYVYQVQQQMLQGVREENKYYQRGGKENE